jgi:hypothetical protein
MGTHWEQGEKTKYNPLPFPFPSLFKRKKLDTFMSACSEIVGHSVSIGHLKGHVPMAEEKWLVQRTWIQAINNANMMSHMQICTRCNNFKKASKKKMTLIWQPYSLTQSK